VAKAQAPKTVPTARSVDDFIAAVENPARQAEAKIILGLMQQVAQEVPKLWGPSIIGFGQYSYTYESGHSGTMCRIGFSPRKANLVVYLLDGYEQRQDHLARLGKHKLGKSCLYLNKLSDIDLAVLKEMIQASWDEMAKRYPA